MRTATMNTVAPISMKDIYRDIREMDGYAFALQTVTHMEYNSEERRNHLGGIVQSINKMYDDLKSNTFAVTSYFKYQLTNLMEGKNVLEFHKHEIDGGWDAYKKVPEILTMLEAQGFITK